MTQSRNGTRDLFDRAARRLEAQGMDRQPLPGPGTLRTSVPAGRTKWSVAVMKDGRRRTRAEAAKTFAHQAFARAAIEAGVSGGHYIWTIPEEMDPRRSR